MEARSDRPEAVLRRWAVSLALAGATVGAACPAAADGGTPSDLRLRASVAAGLVASHDQLEWLRLDLPVLEGRVRAGWVAAEVLTLEVGLDGGAFLSSDEPPGALLDLVVGAELGGEVSGVRPWLSVHLGAGLTGAVVRPVLRLAVGVDVRASAEVSLGPAVTFGHVFQEDGEGFTDDASFFTVGLSLSWRPRRETEVAAHPAPTTPPTTEPSAPRTTRAPPPAATAPVREAELMTMLDEAAGLSPRELLVPVLFAFDSTEPIACSVSALHALREHLEAHPEIRRLEIEGHADGRGADAYNDELSARRAGAVRDWLIEHGVEPSRLRIAARGEREPVEDEADEAAHEQNRRVRFRIVEEDE